MLFQRRNLKITSTFVTMLLVASSLSLLGSSAPTWAKDEVSFDIESWVDEWREAEPAERMALTLKLKRAGVTATALSNALRSIPRFASDELTTGETDTWTAESGDDREHTHYLYVPVSYEAKKPMPMLVWLHGGVTMPRPNMGQLGINYFKEAAEKEGYLLLAPSAAGVPWWTEGGIKVIRDAMRYAAENYNVDADRTAAAGFSDGASGCYHLLQHMPEPFGCFMALLGHPLLTRMMGGPAFVTNATSRPIYAVNGGKDRLYPSARMKPFVDSLKDAGADVTWLDLPEEGHRPAAFVPRWDTWSAYWKEHPRSLDAKSIQWETAKPELTGRFDWVEILSVRPAAGDSEDGEAKSNVLPLPDLAQSKQRPKLGVNIDTKFEGEGLRVSGVTKGMAAAESGVKVGDVLVKVDDVELKTLQDARKLAAMLQELYDADRAGTFTFMRDGETIELEIRPAIPPKPSRGFGDGKPSGRIEATIKAPNHIVVTTKGVAQCRLHLRGPHIDISKPVRVTLNGRDVWNKPVQQTVEYLLSEDARSLGTTAHPFEASILLTP